VTVDPGPHLAPPGELGVAFRLGRRGLVARDVQELDLWPVQRVDGPAGEPALDDPQLEREHVEERVAGHDVGRLEGVGRQRPGPGDELAETASVAVGGAVVVRRQGLEKAVVADGGRIQRVRLHLAEPGLVGEDREVGGRGRGGRVGHALTVTAPGPGGAARSQWMQFPTGTVAVRPSAGAIAVRTLVGVSA
jgi:hypothetical protein